MIAMARVLALLLVLLTQSAMAAERSHTARDVASLEQRLAAHPEQVDAMQDLAAALLGQVRIAPRVETLARAEALIAKLVAMHAPRADALDAWRLLIAHRFEQALAAARRARESGADPLLAAISEADALTELGRYDEAETTVQTLLDAHYGIAALARASHLRRLFGDLPGAIELAEQAMASSNAGVDRAWLALDLAELELSAGAPARALALATIAVADLPAAALAMQGRAQRALGDLHAALALYQAAAARTPRADTEVEILRLALALDDKPLVTRTANLLDGMARLDALNGGGDRRSFIEFHLLRDELPAATALAREEWRQRPDIYSAAQLAWVLFRADERDEAQVFATRAVATHAVDPVLQWRAGTVLAAGGEARGAVLVAAALRIQPWLASDAAMLASR